MFARFNSAKNRLFWLCQMRGLAAMACLWAAAFACLFLVGPSVKADLVVEITRGNDKATPIAVVPFTGGDGIVDVAEVVGRDLRRSGRFAPISPQEMLSLPNYDSRISYREWRQLRVEYVVVGSIDIAKQKATVRFALHNVPRGVQVYKGEVKAETSMLRDAAHQVSDQLYQQLTGVRGAFNTKISYILKTADPPRYALHLADADGARDQVLVSSELPILSPSFSPKGDQLAYVGYQSGGPTVYLYDLASKKSTPLMKSLEHSSAPAWSPDGKTVALTMAPEGNFDIYLYHVRKRRLQRLTEHFGIDTEPVFAPDGDSVLFTSDRSGAPQIYRRFLNKKSAPVLVSKEGAYNARAVPLPDGKGALMVHGSKGKYHIARLLFASNEMRLVSDTRLDESPALAPNGHMLLYGANFDGNGVLMVVALPSLATARLQSKKGEIGDPAWSPYLGE